MEVFFREVGIGITFSKMLLAKCPNKYIYKFLHNSTNDFIYKLYL